MSSSVRGVVVALVAASILTACGGSSEPSTDDAAATTIATAPGPNFGECVSVTDDEVRAAFVVPSFAVVTRNSVGCVWETSGPTGPSVSFSWYRGSPIGRERAGSDLIGRPPADIEIDGHEGFEATALNASGQEFLCESALQFGADFIHYSISYADSPPTADPCVVARSLLELTVSRAS